MIKYSMSSNFVRVCCDLHFKIDDLPAWYRLYVNDELFVERTVDIDEPKAIREILAIKAEPGRYLIWVRGQNQIKASIGHLSILEGTATIDDDQYIVIE